MTYARKSLVSLNDTPYYHCVARCVRRAWLCGIDEYAGKDYSHRKAWVIERLQELTSVFAIEVCAYAVMSNHYHLVLYVDRARALRLSAREVVKRWGALFGLPVLVQRWIKGEGVTAEREAAESLIEGWRCRLYDVSWFMRCLNEHLARRANAEDDCTGRFWEGRFKSQALLDETGVLTAMAYVDLNPIRAGIASTPETSEFTSIEQRIREWRYNRSNTRNRCSVPLKSFRTPEARDRSIPFMIEDYLQLVDWTGRAIRADKRGRIDDRLPPILERLRIDPETWTQSMQPHGNVFGRAIGRLNHLRLHAQTLGQAWLRGVAQAERMYS